MRCHRIDGVLNPMCSVHARDVPHLAKPHNPNFHSPLRLFHLRVKDTVPLRASADALQLGPSLRWLPVHPLQRGLALYSTRRAVRSLPP
jgi:hypothetical protein